jgi:hypothetical protein
MSAQKKVKGLSQCQGHGIAISIPPTRFQLSSLLPLYTDPNFRFSTSRTPMERVEENVRRIRKKEGEVKIKERCDEEVGSTPDDLFNTTKSNNVSIHLETMPSRTHKNTQTRGISMDRTVIFAALIALIGAGASGAFLALGISGANRDQHLRFEEHATEVIKAVQARWNDYEVAALWVHEACRSTSDHPKTTHGFLNMCSREHFHELYEYLRAGGLDFEAVSFIPTIAHENRGALEQEAREYYRENYPDVKYRGITGYEWIGPKKHDYIGISRSEQPFYYPGHYLEPLEGHERFIDVDVMAIPNVNSTAEYLFQWKPAVTGRQTINVKPGITQEHNVIFFQ